ncbi:hypothetical protein CsSME_00053063 [Camellia sinensis var. sinensis]
MARPRNIKNSLMTLNPTFFLHFLALSPFTSLLFSPKKSPRNRHPCSAPKPSFFFLSLLIFFSFLGFLILSSILISQNKVPCSANPSSSPFSSFSFPFFSSSYSPLHIASLSALISASSDDDDDEPRLSQSVMVPLPVHRVSGNLSEEEREFWQQPDGEGYQPCLDLSIGYRRASAGILKGKRRFLMVVVSGGLNQQRNQIIDAVVIARILEAALVVPVLQVNHIWGDESKKEKKKRENNTKQGCFLRIL